ncbi:hypothetical protein BIV60_20990 [Bacillus sp. MUM 116]|uniref:hypothetical protein n=1 Tax=Bacillus sp. MUM 116 TaxID=1678002 RepID=UPI0008F5812A|nr:hypothetical protein [Bacillus sp. MUM 116]OIK10443.1 hypothetical protein BIV60_20990 [Bacillus sp. MUM 116]
MLKKSLWIASLAIIVIISVIIYQNYDSKPSPFPAKNQLVSRINHLFPEAAVNKIQDTVFLDEKNVFVPFISKGSKYGTSFWVWEKRKWELESVNTGGEPQLLKLHLDEPETFYFSWNIDPNSKLSYGKFYLLRDRSFLVTDGKQHYFPKIQIEKKVSFDTKPYGVLQIPKEWVTVLNSFMEQDSAKQSNYFFKNEQINFGWIPFNSKNKAISPHDLNGNSFSNYGEHEEMVRFLGEEEIE